MKKLISLSAALLTAAMLFTACSNPSGGDSGNSSNPGPGSWSSSANWYSDTDSPVFEDNGTGATCGSITRDGTGGAVYTNPNPVETYTGNRALQNGKFRNSAYRFMSDTDITGFEATAKCTSTESTYGFKFNVSTDWNNLYELFIQGNGVLIRKRINSTVTTLQDWINFSEIKSEPAENKVTVYKDGNAIKIFVNGKNVYNINNPELTSGAVAFTCGIGYADIQNHTSITATYKITKLQR